MYPSRTFAFSCLALLVLVALSGQAFSSTVIVGTCKSGVHFTTIGAAVAAAPTGATVDVCPGIYPEQVMINKNLTLIGILPVGSTSDSAVVVSPAAGLATNGSDIFGNPVAAQIFVQNADVTVSHITVDGSNNQLPDCSVDPIGIYYQNASGKITDSAVRDVLMDPALQGCQVGLAINVESNSGAPAITISDNSVRNYDKNYCERPRHRLARTSRHRERQHRHRSRRHFRDCPERHSDRLWRDGVSLDQLCS
jgi:hypothetical protein